jgi:hypothetical protein
MAALTILYILRALLNMVLAVLAAHAHLRAQDPVHGEHLPLIFIQLLLFLLLLLLLVFLLLLLLVLGCILLLLLLLAAAATGCCSG